MVVVVRGCLGVVIACALRGWLSADQLHVQTWEGSLKPAACDIACSWLLMQARNIKVMPHASIDQLFTWIGAR